VSTESNQTSKQAPAITMGKEDYVSIPLSDEEMSVYPVKPLKNKSAAAAPRPTPKLRRSSCSPCMKILIGLVIVFIVMPFILFSIAAVAGYFFIAGQVKALTVTQSREFPVVVVPEAELEMVKDRVTLFWKDLAAGRIPTQDLTITSDELNGFIATSDYMRGNAYLHLEENKLTFETSLPMSNWPGGMGRYFDSSFVAAKSDDDTLAVDMDAPIDAFHGKLVTGLLKFSSDDETHVHHVVNLLYGKAFDMEPCEDFYSENVNILDWIGEDDDDDVDFTKAIDGIDTIKLLKDKIVVTARRPTIDGDESTTDAEVVTTGRLSPWNLLHRLF
jgi:hypothetical protein